MSWEENLQQGRVRRGRDRRRRIRNRRKEIMKILESEVKINVDRMYRCRKRIKKENKINKKIINGKGEEER